MTPAIDTIGLAVTSSTGVMGLAVARVGHDGLSDVGMVEVATERQHAEELGPRLRQLLAERGLTPGDLGWLAVDVGPGRFTGLRVGLATVRGLAFALDLGVVGLSSLEILAAGVTEAGPVTAVIDARRREVFQQVFVGGEPVGAATVGPPEELASSARGVLLGDGLDRYRDLYLPADEAFAEVDPGRTALDGRHPRATDALALARTRPLRPGVEIRPRYLREPDAVANIRTRPEVAAP